MGNKSNERIGVRERCKWVNIMVHQRVQYQVAQCSKECACKVCSATYSLTFGQPTRLVMPDLLIPSANNPYCNLPLPFQTRAWRSLATRIHRLRSSKQRADVAVRPLCRNGLACLIISANTSWVRRTRAKWSPPAIAFARQSRLPDAESPGWCLYAGECHWELIRSTGGMVFCWFSSSIAFILERRNRLSHLLEMQSTIYDDDSSPISS